MSFVVEDGTGLATANSYCSVATADSYFTDRGETGWTGSTAVKQQALVRATDYIEQRYGMRFKGIREFPDEPQALSFPRLYIRDRDGYVVEGIPTKLARATAEYALRALSATQLYPDPTADDSATEVTEKVGPIETSTKWAAGGASELPEYPAADRLLDEYVFSPGVYRN